MKRRVPSERDEEKQNGGTGVVGSHSEMLFDLECSDLGAMHSCQDSHRIVGLMRSCTQSERPLCMCAVLAPTTTTLRQRSDNAPTTLRQRSDDASTTPRRRSVGERGLAVDRFPFTAISKLCFHDEDVNSLRKTRWSSSLSHFWL